MKNKFSFLNILLNGWLLLNIIIIIYQGNNPNIKVIANEAKKDNNLISMLVEQSDGTYQENKENVWNNDKYVFNEKLSGCEQGSKLSYDGEKVTVTANKSDKCYVYFDYVKLNDYLIKLHTSEGANQIYYHDGQGEYPNSNFEIGDFSYRYSGSSESVKNYVCLDGTTAKNTCSSDADLYRIIGLFPNDAGEYETKLIKYDYAKKDQLGDKTTAPGGSYYANYTWGNEFYQGNPDSYSNIAAYRWNYTIGENSSNMWQYSNLNKINLNDYYINTYLAKVNGLSEHITEHKWITGGLTYKSSYTPKQVYDKEVGNEKLAVGANNCYDADFNSGSRACTEEDLFYTDQIGLMYASDYEYASYPNVWKNQIGDEGNNLDDKKANNWMYMGLYDWTISRASDAGKLAWHVYNTGYTEYHYVVGNYAIRPSFYLSSNTKLASGDGSKDSPYRLKL